MWSLRRTPAGRPAGERAIAVARPRASASMAQLCPYVNRIAPKSDWGCVRAHDKRDWARIRRDRLAINDHGLTLDASEDSCVDRLSHEPPTAAGRKPATRSGFRTKISARDFLTGIGCRVTSPMPDP